MGVVIDSARLRQGLGMTGGWYEAGSPEELRDVALADLHTLLRADATGWNELDPASGTLRIAAVPSDAPFLTEQEILAARISEHPLIGPLVLRPEQVPLRFSDVLRRAELRRLPLYQEYFLPLGAAHQMTFVFNARPLLGVALNRERRDFEDAERDLADLIRPHLRAAFGAIGARATARRRLAALARGFDQVAGGVIVIGSDGRIVEASPVARDHLRVWFASTTGRDLPLALHGIGVTPRVFRRPAALLTARRIDGDPRLLLLDEERLAPDPARVRELGLSPREGEVLTLVARGLTDTEIADELYLSPRTVQKHLQNAFAELGVRERRAASALLLQRR